LTAVVIAAACLILITLNPADAGAAEIGTITTPKLNVRPEPGTAKTPVMVISKGATVAILGRDKGWLKIMYKGRVGWVRNRERYIRVEKNKSSGQPVDIVPDTKISRARRKAEAIHRKIEAGRVEVAAFSEKEVQIVNSLDEIDFALNTARKRRSELETELGELEKKIVDTERSIKTLSARIAESRSYAVRRLVALYKLDQVGRIQFFASADSVYEAFQRETTLERVLSYDRNLLATLARNKAEMQRLLGVRQKQKTDRASLEIDLKAQIAEMTAKRKKRRDLLSEIRGKKSLQMAALSALNKSAEELNDKINALNLQVIRTEPSFNLPSKPFADLKGLLKMPVEGKIISKFGPYRNRRFNVKNFRSGIDIQADRGEPVRAVCVGKVIYASWFKGYGNMIIINHGGSYYTVYANIEELFKNAGDSVQAGEVVATVGDTSSGIGSKLYFEIRHHGKPVDPFKWIEKG